MVYLFRRCSGCFSSTRYDTSLLLTILSRIAANINSPTAFSTTILRHRLKVDLEGNFSIPKSFPSVFHVVFLVFHDSHSSLSNRTKPHTSLMVRCFVQLMYHVARMPRILYHAKSHYNIFHGFSPFFLFYHDHVSLSMAAFFWDFYETAVRE